LALAKAMGARAKVGAFVNQFLLPGGHKKNTSCRMRVVAPRGTRGSAECVERFEHAPAARLALSVVGSGFRVEGSGSGI